MADSTTSHSWHSTFELQDLPLFRSTPTDVLIDQPVFVTWADPDATHRAWFLSGGEPVPLGLCSQLQAAYPGATVKFVFFFDPTTWPIAAGSPDPPNTETCP